MKRNVHIEEPLWWIMCKNVKISTCCTPSTIFLIPYKASRCNTIPNLRHTWGHWTSKLQKKERVNPNPSPALCLIVRESLGEIVRITSSIHQSEISPWGWQPSHRALWMLNTIHRGKRGRSQVRGKGEKFVSRSVLATFRMYDLIITTATSLQRHPDRQTHNLSITLMAMTSSQDRPTTAQPFKMRQGGRNPPSSQLWLAFTAKEGNFSLQITTHFLMHFGSLSVWRRHCGVAEWNEVKHRRSSKKKKRGSWFVLGSVMRGIGVMPGVITEKQSLFCDSTTLMKSRGGKKTTKPKQTKAAAKGH